MKNFMVIDGAVNSTFDVFCVDEEMFEIVFPNETDVAFLDEVSDRVKMLELDDVNFFNSLYSAKIDKKTLNGLHGILHSTGSHANKKHYPTRKESETE